MFLFCSFQFNLQKGKFNSFSTKNSKKNQIEFVIRVKCTAHENDKKIEGNNNNTNLKIILSDFVIYISFA